MYKPEYRVPSMGEIRQIPKNGYRLVSTFSGCGGSCLGFRQVDCFWRSLNFSGWIAIKK